MFGRLISTSAATAVLSASVLLASPAQAAPPTPEPRATVSPQRPAPTGNSGTQYADLSKDQKEFTEQVQKATSSTHTNKAGQIDYRWVKKVFGVYTTLRDGFAAGWWSRRGDWGQFTYITSADKKSIEKWATTHGGPNPKASSSALMKPNAPKPCTGVSSAQFNYGQADNYTWLNSCDTNKFKLASAACAPIVGALAAVAGVLTDGVAAVPGVVAGAFCGLNILYVQYAQDASDLNAVIVRISAMYATKNGYRVPYVVSPQ